MRIVLIDGRTALALLFVGSLVFAGNRPAVIFGIAIARAAYTAYAAIGACANIAAMWFVGIAQAVIGTFVTRHIGVSS